MFSRALDNSRLLSSMAIGTTTVFFVAMNYLSKKNEVVNGEEETK